MSKLLTDVQSIRKEAADGGSEVVLTEISSTRNDNRSSPGAVKREQLSDALLSQSLDTPKQILQILRSDPDADRLIPALHTLSSKNTFSSNYNHRVPGPLQAQIIDSIVNSILPTFWPASDHKIRRLIRDCLKNTAGQHAIIARMKFLCDSTINSKASQSNEQELSNLLELSTYIFTNSDFAYETWKDVFHSVASEVQRSIIWKDFVNLLGSGKVLSTVAQTVDVLRQNNITPAVARLSSGAEFAQWIGENVAICSARSAYGEPTTPGAHNAASSLLGKSLSLGHPLALVNGILTTLLRYSSRNEDGVCKDFAMVIGNLPPFIKRQLLENSLWWLSSLTNSESSLGEEFSAKQEKSCSAMAGCISFLLSSDESLRTQLIQFLGDAKLLSSVSFLIRRTCAVAIHDAALEELQALLERVMTTFGDKLFIQHYPILQQEALAQMLLLLAGYLHRRSPMTILLIARASNHMQGVTNRLATTNTRARWLGMIVGTAISCLVDKKGSTMDFGTEDMQTDSAKWYQNLIRVNDPVGTLKDFRIFLGSHERNSRSLKHTPQEMHVEMRPMLHGKPIFGPPRPPIPVQTQSTGEVYEILDGKDDEDEDVDFKPYAKPDADPADSDEDATLVNRNKPRPPVYIRDMMSMLKDDKNHDRFQMGVKHAPALIRRKSNFGREVRDHAVEIGLILCDLRDPFETENFDELKLQALIAVVLSDVETIGSWLSNQVFSGDYSISQRCIMLSALGLGGREIAGLKDQDNLNPTLPDSSISFPSRRLPDRLHSMYSQPTRSTQRLENASKIIQHQLIKPIALTAADKTTSHLNAVKVRTFSSRIDVERTKRKPAPNQLAKVFERCFFLPLVSRYRQEVEAYGPNTVFSSAPFVLVTFVKTLALLLHASGPATLNLREIAEAFWDLLLSLQVRAVSDISVQEAALFALLTLLETSSEARRNLARELPEHLMKTQQWAESIFDRIGAGEFIAGSGDDEASVRTLAAGVLVKIREMIEEYQKELVGSSQ